MVGRNASLCSFFGGPSCCLLPQPPFLVFFIAFFFFWQMRANLFGMRHMKEFLQPRLVFGEVERTVVPGCMDGKWSKNAVWEVF